MKKRLKSGQFKEGKKGGNRDGRDDKPSKKQKHESRNKPSWIFERPKDADLTKPREWNGTKWYYCPTETDGKMSWSLSQASLIQMQDLPVQTSKKGNGQERQIQKEKWWRRWRHGVVAQQVFGESSPPSDDGVLMGGCESGWHLVSWLICVKIISVSYFLCQMHTHYSSFICLIQGEHIYVPKRKMWNRLNHAWSLMTWLVSRCLLLSE